MGSLTIRTLDDGLKARLRLRAAGRPVGTADAQIAAIAPASGASLATRNGADFIDCGVAVIDPWPGRA